MCARTVGMKYLVPVLAVGCAPFFETVDLACEGEFPGLEFISDPETIEAATRLNCYRRAARVPRLRVDETVQEVAELHSDYLEAHPTLLAFDFQNSANELFTGSNDLERLRAAGYVEPTNPGYLFLTTWVEGDLTNSFNGAYWSDFWWTNPTSRVDLMQSRVQAAGLDIARYEVPAFDPDEPPIPVEVMRWMFVIPTPPDTVAESIISYPTNGQLDVPPSYAHLTNLQNDVLTPGETYGYPIVFQVGVAETGLTVVQSYFGQLDVENGGLGHQLMFGGSLSGTFDNSVVLVPDEPLLPQQDYLAIVTLQTNQGLRRKRVQFRTGGQPLVPPAGLNLRTMAEYVPPL